MQLRFFSRHQAQVLCAIRGVLVLCVAAFSVSSLIWGIEQNVPAHFEFGANSEYCPEYGADQHHVQPLKPACKNCRDIPPHPEKPAPASAKAAHLFSPVALQPSVVTDNWIALSLQVSNPVRLPQPPPTSGPLAILKTIILRI